MMRVAVIVVSIVAVTTPSFASDSCMTKAEARQRFATSYLYWHGPDHCWDAKAGRSRLTRSSKQKPDEQVHAPKWREALSELPPDEPDRPDVSSEKDATPRAERNDTTNNAPIPGVAWSDRWVDVVQVAAVPVANQPTATLSISARSSEPGITAGGVILIWLGIFMVVAVIEFARRSVRL